MLSQHALQVVSQLALQQVSRGGGIPAYLAGLQAYTRGGGLQALLECILVLSLQYLSNIYTTFAAVLYYLATGLKSTYTVTS